MLTAANGQNFGRQFGTRYGVVALACAAVAIFVLGFVSALVFVRPTKAEGNPHFHPNDRFVMVLSGTWWVGTGNKYDPDSTVPMPTGTFAEHYGKHVHYDGAKDGDVVLEIVGDGPATQVAAEEK
jgi:hypothetical protein